MVDKHLFRTLTQFWNPAYSCFTFGRVDLVPTKLMNITGMSEQWVAARIKQKGDSKCILWKNLKDLILAHLDTMKKVDIFALSVYDLVVFPKPWGTLIKR
ncbi:hypothetical protein Gogos_020861 [Gossypium gossypioides]|uniref:Uncharacterized protein n=1 Tax=Gossypium gossypioides TaxID=34282 RepID=A0A7J9D218_GOSGO|nr:hypothetical protein [Gossypium gossypioides]